MFSKTWLDSIRNMITNEYGQPDEKNFWGFNFQEDYFIYFKLLDNVLYFILPHVEAGIYMKADTTIMHTVTFLDLVPPSDLYKNQNFPHVMPIQNGRQVLLLIRFILTNIVGRYEAHRSYTAETIATTRESYRTKTFVQEMLYLAQQDCTRPAAEIIEMLNDELYKLNMYRTIHPWNYIE